MSWIEIEHRDRVRWLWFQRPDRMNAVPPAGWRQLAEALADFEESADRVLVLAGRGENFCAGADLDPSEEIEGVVDRRNRMREVSGTALALHRLTKPTIAAVDGVAVGAGLNLALGCDLVVATTRARFAEIFVRRGLALDFGGSWLLPRVVGYQRARDLALTGRLVEADEAVSIGLALEAVAPELLEERAGWWAERLLDGSPLAQMFVKQTLDRAAESSFEDALDSESAAQAICLSSEDFVEGVAAFLQKRPPSWRGR